jgi:NAD-dependent SIR2 family protein deacetylase
VPFELDRIYRALDQCTLFMAIGTSGVVEPAASFASRLPTRKPSPDLPFRSRSAAWTVGGTPAPSEL